MSHFHRRTVRILVAGLLLSLPSVMIGQAHPVSRNDSLSACVRCRNETHFTRAAIESFFSEMMPYIKDRWVDHQPWARTGPRTWWDNLKHGWEWDNDHFVANQFAHPYSGNLYFSAARANGFGFWSAAPFAMAGSMMWEYMGETNRPSINDLANTTLGGITMGEMTYRLANLIRGGHATGAGRVAREIGATLVNPVSAFNRVVRGGEDRAGPDASVQGPLSVTGSLEFGLQHLDNRVTAERGQDQKYAFLTLAYGDPLTSPIRHPFDAFRMEAAVASPGPGPFSQVRAGGVLAARDLKVSERSRHRLLLDMHYHYYDNRAFVGGGQGFSGALLSRFALGTKNVVRTEAWLTGFALAAVKSDYSADSASLANEKARNYDYGPGGGTRLRARFEHGDRWFLDLAYQGFWIGVLSGAAQHHFYETMTTQWQLRVHGHLAVGQRDLVYVRTSWYASHPTTHINDIQLQGYVAWIF